MIQSQYRKKKESLKSSHFRHIYITDLNLLFMLFIINTKFFFLIICCFLGVKQNIQFTFTVTTLSLSEGRRKGEQDVERTCIIYSTECVIFTCFLVTNTFNQLESKQIMKEKNILYSIHHPSQLKEICDNVFLLLVCGGFTLRLWINSTTTTVVWGCFYFPIK